MPMATRRVRRQSQRLSPARSSGEFDVNIEEGTDLRGSGVSDEHALVLSVHASARHSFSKHPQSSILLLEGLGVEGDAHCGRLVKHRHDAGKDPLRPNRRQVHLLQAELLDEVNARGFSVLPGDLGENISTRHIDLLGLPRDTRLQIGDEAIVEITGLRDPCVYIDRFQKGLLAAVVKRRPNRAIVKKTGVMSIVIRGGLVRPSDKIAIELPAIRLPLSPV
jgi:MOSC domain-containing protein YiiM